MTDISTLPDTTRVWIYQSNRPFMDENLEHIQEKINAFTHHWVSHNNQLKAGGRILHKQFIVLMVDESMAGASGCSIDKSVHFMKILEQEFSVNLFDRMSFTYKQGEEVRTAARAEFARLYKENIINDDTLVFDNLVNTKGDFEKKWIVPLKDSWHKRMV